MSNAYLDVALMANILPFNSPEKKVKNTFLLGMLELKNVIKRNEFEVFAQQTICYMVSAMAYSRCGL